MEISKKLRQSQCSECIYFFREGMFVQLYGVSLYMAITQLNLNLKLRLQRYKKLGNRPILKAGIPSKVLKQQSLEGLEEKTFGYQLSCSWLVEKADYKKWYAEQLSVLLMQERQREQLQRDTEDMRRNNGLIFFWLTEKEYEFLLNWREGKYATGIEQKFMKHLQRKIASSCA